MSSYLTFYQKKKKLCHLFMIKRNVIMKYGQNSFVKKKKKKTYEQDSKNHFSNCLRDFSHEVIIFFFCTFCINAYSSSISPLGCICLAYWLLWSRPSYFNFACFFYVYDFILASFAKLLACTLTSLAITVLISKALTLVLCSILSNQQLLEKHLEKHLLNANAFQMLYNL